MVYGDELYLVSWILLMQRRPPGSTRTYTLFPYTTLFRTLFVGCLEQAEGRIRRAVNDLDVLHAGLIAGPSNVRNLGASCQRSEEHTSELQSLMRTSYAVCCLKKKTTH